MTPREEEYGTTTPFPGQGEEPLGEKSTAELEAEINQIRAEMDSTLTAIERRFSPGEVLDRALHSIKGGPSEYATNLGRSIRDNPLPSALVGIGLGWLFLSEAGLTHTAAEKTGEWKESSGEVAGRAKGKLQQASHSLSERLHQTGERLHEVREKARGTGGKLTENVSTVGQTIRDNPIPAVLAGIGLGWLFLSRAPVAGVAAERTGEFQEAGHRMASRAREKFQATSHTVSERMHGTGEKARGTREKLSGQAQILRERAQAVRERAQQARGGYRQIREEKPLLLMAMGAAVGILVGIVLPISRKEKEKLGGAGAEILSRGKRVAEQAAEKAGYVASAAAEAAREETERQLH